jgi:hypothetical protein
MGSGASKTKQVPKSEPARQQATPANEPTSPPKKAVAFEVDLGESNNKQASASKMPAKLRDKIAASRSNDLTKEELDAKLAAAETRRKENENELTSKLHQYNSDVDRVRQEQKQQEAAALDTSNNPPASSAPQPTKDSKASKKSSAASVKKK